MAMMFCCGGPRIPAMMPGSPMRELREYVSGFENAFSLSLRFGLQSVGFFSLVRMKPRHQNLWQGRESSGAHSIARQLVPNSIAAEGCFGTRSESNLRLTHLCGSV